MELVEVVERLLRLSRIDGSVEAEAESAALGVRSAVVYVVVHRLRSESLLGLLELLELLGEWLSRELLRMELLRLKLLRSELLLRNELRLLVELLRNELRLLIELLRSELLLRSKLLLRIKLRLLIELLRNKLRLVELLLLVGQRRQTRHLDGRSRRQRSSGTSGLRSAHRTNWRNRLGSLRKWLRRNRKSGHRLGKVVSLGFESRFTGLVFDRLQLATLVDVAVLALDVAISVTRLDLEGAIRRFETVSVRTIIIYFIDRF